jgi:hypothetical protein
MFTVPLLLRMRRAEIISYVRRQIRQTGSAKLASPMSAGLFVVNRHFLSQFRVPGETRLAKLAPQISLGDGGLAHS